MAILSRGDELNDNRFLFTLFEQQFINAFINTQ